MPTMDADLTALARLAVGIGGVPIIAFVLRDQVELMGANAARVLLGISLIVFASVAVIDQGVRLEVDEITWRLPVSLVAVVTGVVGVYLDRRGPGPPRAP